MRKFLALAIPLALLFVAAPHAQADKPGTTKISIKSIPAVYGYVKSSRTRLCAGRRSVTVYREKAGKDKKIATTRTTAYDGAWQWSIKEKPNGEIYAKSSAKMGCSAGRSKSIRVTTVADTPAPPCPSLATGICSFGSSVQTAFRIQAAQGCPQFSKRADGCDVPAIGGPKAWRTLSTGNFHWNTNSGSVGVRGVAWYNGDAFLEGGMSNFDSNGYWITDARAEKDGPHFCTPNLPGKAPGERGGPLNFNFTRASNVSYFRMYGFMVKKDDNKGC
ncbi:MAG: hypothetical protein ACSLFI_12835 [Solirubrobacterales bacterium]